METKTRELIPVEYQGQRILITAQLAESYGADEKLISQNFSRNQERYKEGKHFFLLKGEALKAFKEAYPQFEGNLKFAPILQLWTEKGAWLHAKSLNTDKAWEAYEMLVDEYYRAQEVVKKITNQTWEKSAIGEVRFAKEFAKAAGIRTERALAVALARIERQCGTMLADYRKMLPPVEDEEAEIYTPGEIGEKFGLKANQVNLILETVGLQVGTREPGKKEGTTRLVKRNPWRLTDKGKQYGIMQDSSKQTSGSKWEGFQILWNAKAIEVIKKHLQQPPI